MKGENFFHKTKTTQRTYLELNPKRHSIVDFPNKIIHLNI